MKSLRREEKAVSQLLRVASLRADELKARLADAETARASAQSSIDWLVQAVRAEEMNSSATPGALADFQRYLAGAEEKRKTLHATCVRLGVEIETMRADLAEAAVEVRKLEHLAGLKAEEIAEATRKSEEVRLDEAAAQRRDGSSSA